MKSNQKSNQPNLDREDAWMSILEVTIIFLANCLAPENPIALFALKLCFQTLKALRHDHRNHQK